MKHFAVIFVFCAAAFAQDFLTGQAARITIGQTTFSSQDTGNASQYQLGAVGGVAFANDTLFVVDSNYVQATPVQNRVLIYNNVSQFIPAPTAVVPQDSRCPVCIGPAVGGPSVVLGQADFTTANAGTSSAGLQTPTGIATDGKVLAVADTNNNRILIWKTIPTANNTPADIVLGQPDFNTVKLPTVDSSSLRGPEGVWIQGTRLFVADTQNHRVMVWNNIPSSNNQAADYVLGEPNFTTAPPQTVNDVPPQANNLFSPVSVTSDGVHLFVTDLGHNRVLIWNSIPTQTQQPADVVVGQPDMTSETQNNALGTCVSNGTDSAGNPTYPAGCTTFCPKNGIDSASNPTYPLRCGLTLSFPRFALSDGQRLFIADGGNDRILVYNSIPTQNGQKADVILGQPSEFVDQITDSGGASVLPSANLTSSSPDSIRTPLSLAWDGVNLYVADPFDRRVLAYSVGSANVPVNGITNSASENVYALGSLTFSGTITANDTITVTINGTNYKYTVVKADTLITIVENVTSLINGASGGTPDPNVLATGNPAFNQIILTSKIPGAGGNSITYSVATAPASTGGTVTETVIAAGAELSGGTTAAQVAPGTLVTISGTNLSDVPAQGVPGVPYSNGFYPNTVGGVQVYFDGLQAPLIFVSPTQINTQVPFIVGDTNGISAVVRTVHQDGTVTSSNAIAIPIVPQNPGIFAGPGNDPRPAIAYHTSSHAIALVDITGEIAGGGTGTIGIGGRNYTYTVQATDTLTTVRDGLIELINANSSERVTASASSEFDRIILTAKAPGPDGNGIAITVASAGSSTTSAKLALSTLGNAFTCCASVAGRRVTPDNPAIPGEVISIYATGLGVATLADGSTIAGSSGQIYQGPAYNVPETLVDNAQVGGQTANVLSAGLMPGMIGVYEVKLQLNTTLPSNPHTQMYIAQSFFTSNIVTIPVVSPSQ